MSSSGIHEHKAFDAEIFDGFLFGFFHCANP